jgi:hypothetical protein
MASKPETTFTHSVHRHLPVTLYRMKTHNPYLSGPADVWYSGRGGDLWVEYKFEVLPKRATTLVQPGLSALQTDWLRARHGEGRNVAVIVGCREGGVIYRALEWEAAMPLAQFRARLQDRAALAAFITAQTGEGA